MSTLRRKTNAFTVTFQAVRAKRNVQEKIGNDTTRYFIISVLFSIGDHNIYSLYKTKIHSRKIAYIIFYSSHALSFYAWNLKVKFPHHHISFFIFAYTALVLWFSLLYSVSFNSLWRFAYQLCKSRRVTCLCVCVFVRVRV